MTREIVTDIEINVPVEVVWKELIDFSSYPSWNPFIQFIKGELAHDARLSVLVCPPNNKSIRFSPVVHVLEENKKIVWLGRLLLPGIFDGEHSFELIPLSENKTRFVHKEKFSGVLIPMLWPKLGKNTRQGFVNMNKALKSRCEIE